MLLSYLDRMKPGHAFLDTTNPDVASLTERSQTRFLPVRLIGSSVAKCCKLGRVNEGLDQHR